MDIDALFEQNSTFTADVEFNIPGMKADRRHRFKATYKYLDQDKIDALMNGEPTELDGVEIDTDDEDDTVDAKVLNAVLVDWTGFKAGGEEIEFSEDNKAKAIKHTPIRSALVTTFFARLTGGRRGGKRGKRRT